MIDRGLWCDPMSKVEDMWTAIHGIKYFINRPYHRIAARD